VDGTAPPFRTDSICDPVITSPSPTHRCAEEMSPVCVSASALSRKQVLPGQHLFVGPHSYYEATLSRRVLVDVHATRWQ
jgi:hypothetical protein